MKLLQNTYYKKYCISFKNGTQSTETESVKTSETVVVDGSSGRKTVVEEMTIKNDDWVDRQGKKL